VRPCGSAADAQNVCCDTAVKPVLKAGSTTEVSPAATGRARHLVGFDEWVRRGPLGSTTPTNEYSLGIAAPLRDLRARGQRVGAR